MSEFSLKLAEEQIGILREALLESKAENAALKRVAEKSLLFNDVFIERFHIYSRHKHGCTYDQLDKYDVCTCGLQALITMYYEIKDALLTEQESER